MEKKKLNKGFTLLEVMIAMAIFAVFATAFVAGFGGNLRDSSELKEDILLKELCENKINEIISNPPTYQESITLTKEIKDIDHYPNYQSIVEYKRFFVPDMNKITGENKSDSDESNSESESEAEGNQRKQMEQKIFKVFKENIEKILWQVEVTVKNKVSGETFRLSAWTVDQNAEVKIEMF